VYVMGGTSSKAIDIYDSAAISFATTGLPVLNSTRFGATATPNGSGSIILTGGATSSGGSGTQSVEQFDTTTNTSHLYGGANSSLSVGRAEHSATLFGKWLVIVGGSPTSASVDVIDTTLSTAGGNQVASFNPSGGQIRLAQAAAAVDASTLLVAGGLSATGTPISSMQTYTFNSAAGTVSAVSAAQALVHARARFALLVIGSAKFLAVGGTTAMSALGDTATASIEEIDATQLTTIAWPTSLSVARQAFGAAKLSFSAATNSVFLLAGGASSSSSELLVMPN